MLFSTPYRKDIFFSQSRRKRREIINNVVFDNTIHLPKKSIRNQTEHQLIKYPSFPGTPENLPPFEGLPAGKAGGKGGDVNFSSNINEN